MYKHIIDFPNFLTFFFKDDTKSVQVFSFSKRNKKCRNAYVSSISALYPGRDLNPHARDEHRILSPACLPIPPPGRDCQEKKPSSEGLVLRAKDGIRTRDPDLGKVVLYQLSYFRVWVCKFINILKTPRFFLFPK